MKGCADFVFGLISLGIALVGLVAAVLIIGVGGLSLILAALPFIVIVGGIILVLAML